MKEQATTDGGAPFRTLESLGVEARHVERPTKEREAQQVLARAFKEKLTVLPVGGATAISAGTLPERVDIVLDMTGMEGIAHFDISNLNMTVLAGTTLNGINEFLAGQGNGFFLPLDPPFSERATIGGVYASNGSGPSRLRYGAVRDQVLGVRGIDAQGGEVGFGGKTVKNVSGYDLTKFLIGSAGSLCLITAAIMRVYPLPAASSICEVTFPAIGELEKFLQALRSSVLLPSGVTVEQVLGAFRVLSAFEGHPLAVERENRDFLSLAGPFGGKGEAKMGREVMEEAIRGAIEPVGDAMAIKVTVPLSEGPATLAGLKDLAGPAKTVLFAGNGVILVYGADERIIDGAKRLAAHGYVAPIRLHRSLLSTWGPRVNPALEQIVLRPIKEKLDPSGVFPPIL
ncbi:MAG: FAD-binding oxidoreductase [Syntrophorhabdales bacterium]|jgi:glycolate oxidase FAD binding subunit